ncbi:hypothetical protein CJ030_MR0G020323 [Morella rubra]|uniref:Uncharacterized protein n=1 Tax=Morella rubra TaxID=262757 RepID=A0A6A1UHA8_9ROSI|nr:hypothetical protein CJ030_MR0G020323 [Morella rubra]
MTDHPRLVNLRTASQIFRETTSSFISNLPTFILLTILLFCFRTTVEDGTRHVTSFIDRDPSLKALLSRLDLAGTHGNRHRLSSPEDSPAALHRRRRRPFLHLTRVGTLDDDFFSGDDEDDRSPFGSNRKPSLNGSFVILNNFHPELGFSNPIIYNGINIPEIVRTGITFRADSLYLSSSDADNHSDNSDEREENETIGLEKGVKKYRTPNQVWDEHLEEMKRESLINVDRRHERGFPLWFRNRRRSVINQENRAKLKIVHTSGARSFQRARALLEKMKALLSQRESHTPK